MCSRASSGFLSGVEWLRWDGGRTAAGEVRTSRGEAAPRAPVAARPRRQRSGQFGTSGGVLTEHERPVEPMARTSLGVRPGRSSDQCVALAVAESTAGSTWKLNIMPLSWCSAMWQCAIHTPGLVTSSRMSTVSPRRTSTVSFHTRFGSMVPSRLRIRNRPAPCTWNGWCIGWSESISLTSRIFTWSPTRNRQSIPWFRSPVSRSSRIHRMFAGVVIRFTSTMSSSHSMPSPAGAWPAW